MKSRTSVSLSSPSDAGSSREITRLYTAAGADWPAGTVLTPANPITAADREWWCFQPLAYPAVPEPPAELSGWCQNQFVKATGSG